MLETCPFCHGEADTNTLHTQPRKQYYLSCMSVGCGTEGPIRHSLEEAISAWNIWVTILPEKFRAMCEKSINPDLYTTLIDEIIPSLELARRK